MLDKTLLILLAPLFTLSLYQPAWATCHVGIPDDCPDGRVCAKYNNKGESRCFAVPETAPILFDLPFDSSTKVICTQSSRNSTASHSYRSILYAIDLATPYDQPASSVRATADGIAYSYAGCKDPEGTPQQTKTDNCGLGYGNHVRILHPNGYISLYAHLSQVYVKTGDHVQKGQSIGMEGATGMAAFRHLHWDINKLEGTKEDWEKILNNPGWGGYSVPYKFRAQVGKVQKILDSSTIYCHWLDMTQVPFSGVKK